MDLNKLMKSIDAPTPWEQLLAIERRKAYRRGEAEGWYKRMRPSAFTPQADVYSVRLIDEDLKLVDDVLLYERPHWGYFEVAGTPKISLEPFDPTSPVGPTANIERWHVQDYYAITFVAEVVLGSVDAPEKVIKLARDSYRREVCFGFLVAKS